MADKKKSEINLFPYFVDGEQPTANKFNSIGIQISRNLYIIEKSLGDIWGESEPYSSLNPEGKLSFGNSRLFDYSLRNGVSSKDRTRSLNITSLARVIGPSSKLNPMLLVEGLYEGGNTYARISSITEPISAGSKSYSLKFKPTEGSSITVEKNSAALSLKTLSNLTFDENEYYYNAERAEIVFGKEISAQCEVTYTTTPSEYSGGPSYSGSSFNVIPDEAQIESGTEITIVDSQNGYYELTLPKVSHTNLPLVNETSVTLQETDPLYETQLKLPVVLREMFGGNMFDENDTSTLAMDSLIPEGFLYLKNVTTGVVFSQSEYYYMSDTSLKMIPGANEDIGNLSGDKFCIITVGTDITSSIQDLNFKNFKHSHDRSFGEAPISFKSLVGGTEEITSKGQFYDSEIPGNYLPQYLHRDGWSSSINDGLNDANAMRGNLLLGKSSGTTGDYVGSGSSYSLFFGNEDTYMYRNATTLHISNEGKTQSDSYDLVLRGNNFCNSNNVSSDFTANRFKNYNFECVPNEYRSSATQRPGRFLFEGAPVYLNGLDSETVTDSGNGNTVISGVSLRLANNRQDAKRATDYEATSSDWFCPGIGIACLYIDNARFSASAADDVEPLAAFYDIPLPRIGSGWEDQFTASETTTSGVDVRITADQVISINVLVKPRSSNYYIPINGAPTESSINLGHSSATYNLIVESDPDTDTEYIRIWLPYSNTNNYDLSAIDVDSNGFPTTWHGDEDVDLRVTIMYLTHRDGLT